MHALKQLIRGIASQPWYWKLWTTLIGVVNFVLPWMFVQHLEAQVVLGVFVVNVITMVALCALAGFNRLLGFANFLWLPLLYFLWVSLPDTPADTPFGLWIRLLMVVNAISLLVNGIDVIRFIMGEREEL